jgi:formimidoylglutamate deiminase
MRIFAKFVLTDAGWRKNQLLSVTRGRLESLGPGKREQADHAFDCLLPGMVNAHSHAFQWGFAGATEHKSGPHSDSFWSWREQMYETALKLSPEQVEALAASLYMRMLESGYTRVAEFHYLHKDPEGQMYPSPGEMSHRVIRAALDAGIGICHLPVLYQHGGFGGIPVEARQRRFVLGDDDYSVLLDDVHNRWGKEPAVTLGLAPHSLRAVDIDALPDKIAQWESRAEALHIHISEQPAEVERCLEAYGRRPIELLLERVSVDQRWSLVHATHASDNELEELARVGARVVLCPSTEANLGDGLFPMETWRAAGGAWAIGSDSHISVAVTEELRWLEYGMRLRTHQRVCYADAGRPWVARNLFWDAVEGGRAAIGMTPCPWTEGEQVDCLGFRWPAWWPDDDPDVCLARWLFSGEPARPDAVMAAGQWRVWNGEHVSRAILDSRLAAAIQSP